MYRVLKFLHLLGFAVFFGSVLSHIVEGRPSAAALNPAAAVYARDTIQLASYVLTTPGLALAVISGLGMLVLRRQELLSKRWFQVHLALGLVIATASVVIVKAGAQLKASIDALASAPGSAELPRIAGLIERYVGAANVLLVLISVGIALARPRMRRAGRSEADA